MLAPLLLGLQLATAAAPAPAAALVEALLSQDEPTWREAALKLSLAGPEGARAVAAQGERLKASHRAVNAYLMLALLQSVSPQELRALPALANYWEPKVAEARQWLQRPVLLRRPGARANPRSTENLAPEQREAAENGATVRRMQGLLVPIYLEKLSSADPNEKMDALLALERLRAFSAKAEVERLAGDLTRPAEDALAKSARRFLDLWSKAAAEPNAAALAFEPLLAAMVIAEEAGERDELWKGIAASAPAALQAKTSDEFWSRSRRAFAAFWRAAASPKDGRPAALAAWADRCRGYSLTVSEGAALRVELNGPAGARVSVADAASGAPLKQGALPLSFTAKAPAAVRVAAQLRSRKVELTAQPRANGTLQVELYDPW